MRRLFIFTAAIVTGLCIAVVANATRNASGTYSLPAGNPVVSGTSISSTWANNTLSDISTEMTDSLNRSGKGPMLAPLRATDGTAAAPSLTFDSDTDSGFYRIGANNVGMTLGGSKVFDFGTGTLKGPSGLVGSPTYSFNTEATTGLWLNAAGDARFSLAGTAINKWTSAGLSLLSGQMLTTDGSVSAPAYAFTSETNTGWYRAGANDMRATVGGTGILQVSSGVSVLSGNFAVATGNATVTGTLGVTGATTATGGLKIGSTAAGGIAITVGAFLAPQIDFASTADKACSTSAQSITGITTGGVCEVSADTAPANGTWVDCHVTGAGTATVRFCNNSGAASDPANQFYRIRVWQ